MNPPTVPSKSLINTMRDATQRAATALAEILNCDVEMHLDQVRILNQSEFGDFIHSEAGEQGTVVKLGFFGRLSGNSYFLLPAKNEQIILKILTEQDPKLLADSSDQLEVITEVGNVVLNMYVGTVMNQMGAHVSYETPSFLLKNESLEKLIDFENAQSPVLPYEIMTSRLSFSGREVIVYILLGFSNKSN